MPTDSPSDVRPRWQDDPTVKEMRERVMQDIAAGGPSDLSRPWPSLTELCEAVAVASLPRVGPRHSIECSNGRCAKCDGELMEGAPCACSCHAHRVGPSPAPKWSFEDVRRELQAELANVDENAREKRCDDDSRIELIAFAAYLFFKARSHPTGLREQVTDRMARVAATEYAAQHGESFGAMWEQMTDGDRKQMLADWRGILRMALAASTLDGGSDAR